MHPMHSCKSTDINCWGIDSVCGSRLEAWVGSGVGSLNREEWRKSIHREGSGPGLAWALKGLPVLHLLEGLGI